MGFKNNVRRATALRATHDHGGIAWSTLFSETMLLWLKENNESILYRHELLCALCTCYSQFLLEEAFDLFHPRLSLGASWDLCCSYFHFCLHRTHLLNVSFIIYIKLKLCNCLKDYLKEFEMRPSLLKTSPRHYNGKLGSRATGKFGLICSSFSC